jgi:uncharacterized protein YcfJ
MQAKTRPLSRLTASLLLAGLTSTSAIAQVTFFELDNFQGRSFTTSQAVGNFRDVGLEGRAASMVVTSNRWEVCDDVNAGGRCAVVRPGSYASLADIGLNNRIASVRLLGGESGRSVTPATPVAGMGTEAVVFYENPNYKGRTIGTQQEVADFIGSGFKDRASSLVINSHRWEVCDGTDYSGRCVVLRPGKYPTLASMGLSNRISSVRMVGVEHRDPAPVAAATDAVVFHEHENFQGRTFGARQSVANFTTSGFNDRASSVVVNSQRWQVCDAADFAGRCVVLAPGRYPSLAAVGLNDRISSVRMLAPERSEDSRDNQAGASSPSPWERRPGERLFVVPVTSVRAVVATPEERCWIEQKPVPQAKSDKRNVPGAVVGAIIGGVLGHQVGKGTGRDIATAGGVVAGAVVGSRVGGGDDSPAKTQDVKRCETVPSTKSADYWDVAYTFRGREHHVQMSTPPGPTITVNRQGEPRV